MSARESYSTQHSQSRSSINSISSGRPEIGIPSPTVWIGKSSLDMIGIPTVGTS